MREFNWKMPDGVEIYARDWKPAGEVNGVVLILHGLGEHIGRYEHVAGFFNNNGFAVMGNDHYGHGRTTGKKGHIPKVGMFSDEVDQLLAQAKALYPGKPVFVYGHSMGGLIGLSWLIERTPSIQGMIATGPAIKLAFEPPKFLLALGKLTRKIIPGFTQHNQLNASDVSRDPDVVEAYKNDPLVHHYVSSELGLGIIEKGNMVYNFTGTVPCPVLVMHGTEDRLTSPRGSEMFTRQAKGDVTLKLWEGFYHEIHNEPEKQEVFDYTLSWMKSKI